MNEAEVQGRLFSEEQLDMVHLRYKVASRYSRDKRVLDIGCGTGVGYKYMEQCSRTYICGDISEQNIAELKRVHGREANAQVLDAHNLPFSDNNFDVIMAMEVINYLNYNKFIEECKRVLKKDGTLIFSLPNKNSHGFKPSKMNKKYVNVKELRELMERHNLGVEIFGAFPCQKNGGSLTYQTKKSILRILVNTLNILPYGRKIRYMINKSILKKKPLENIVNKADIRKSVELEKLEESNKELKIIYVISKKVKQ